MELTTVRDIRSKLSEGRTLFHYFRDRYALMLLSWFVGNGKTVAEVKGSRFGRLLRKPSVRPLLARLDSGCLTRRVLDCGWPARPEVYVLTAGEWGEPDGWDRDWHQMTRRGTNLVLQLNFSREHDRAYDGLLGPDSDGADLFNSFLHPVNRAGRHTLAWARIDGDLDDAEALVEEVQSDWVNVALLEGRLIDEDDIWAPERRSIELGGRSIEVQNLHRYLERALAPHVKLWEEATLAAAIWLLREKLGIRTIFYHTRESGEHFKRCEPPRSLYSALPRRFCFAPTTRAPQFVLRQRSTDNFIRCAFKNRTFRWFVLEL